MRFSVLPECLCHQLMRRNDRTELETFIALNRLVGIECNAHCSNSSFSGEGPAQALWRNGTRRRLLVEEVVELGHKITLFASGDSQTKADLILFAPVPCAWGSRVQIRWPHRRPCSKRWQEEQTNST